MHSVLIDGVEYVPRATSAALAKATTLAARLKIWHRHWKLIDGGRFCIAATALRRSGPRTLAGSSSMIQAVGDPMAMPLPRGMPWPRC